LREFVDSGYAEFVTAPEDFIYPLPASVSSRESAPFLCAGIIGYRALRRSNLKKGETLGLYGFGASAHNQGHFTDSTFIRAENQAREEAGASLAAAIERIAGIVANQNRQLVTH